MKKKLLVLLLSLVVIVSMLAVAACEPTKPPEDEIPGGNEIDFAVLEKQVETAQETFSGIYGATNSSFTAPLSAESMSLSPLLASGDFRDEIGEVFKKGYAAQGSGFYATTAVVTSPHFVLSGVTDALLEAVGTDALLYDCPVVITVNGGAKTPTTPGSSTPWPALVSFKGVQEENGRENVYTSFITEVDSLQQPKVKIGFPDSNGNYEVIDNPYHGVTYTQLSSSYYTSDFDYGFECIYTNSNYEEDLLLINYYRFDLKQYIDEYISFSYVPGLGYVGRYEGRNTKNQIIKTTLSSPEALEELREILFSKYTEIYGIGEQLIENNLMGIKKAMNDEKLDLEFDTDKYDKWPETEGKMVRTDNGTFEWVVDPFANVARYKVTPVMYGAVRASFEGPVVEGASLYYFLRNLKSYDFEDGIAVDGWYEDEACTIKIPEDAVVTSDIRVYGCYMIADESYKKISAVIENGDAPQFFAGKIGSKLEEQYLGSFGSSRAAYARGLIFDGWYLDATYTTKYEFPLTVTDDIVLYGRYILADENHKKITAVIDGAPCPWFIGWADGEELGDFWSTTEFGVRWPMGYILDGWYLDEEMTIKAERSLKITEDTILYARWVEK